MLTQEVHSGLYEQIKTDPIIAARYLGWIKDKKSKKIPFFPNKSQIKYKFLKDKAIREGKRPLFMILKSRRMGFTTYEQWENLHLCRFNKNISALTIAHEAESTQLIFNIAKFFYDNLHKSLQIGETKLNKREIKFPKNGSHFYIGTAGSTGFGRGQTIQKAHCSEVAFWPGNLDDIDNLIIGITEACSEGQVVLETTANGRDNWFYNTWMGAKKGDNAWIPFFFPWFEDLTYQSTNQLLIDEVRESLEDEEISLIEEYKLTFAQLAWRREKIQELKSKKKFDQEYPKNDMVAFIASGSCFFDVEMIQTLMSGVSNPIPRATLIDKGLLILNDDIQYWALPDKNKKYLAASDTAGGSINETSNYCVTTISEKETLRQVARLRVKLPPDDFGRINCNKFLPQFNNPLWGIEANNHGHSVINTAYNECGYANLYRSQHNINNKFLKSNDYGFITNSRTRPMLLDDLNDFLWDCAKELKNNGVKGIINDPIFLDECLNFVDNEGKYEAAMGTFDDTIFPNGIILQMAKQPEISINFV